MSKPTTVHVVTGHSESGDDYGPTVFAKKPTDTVLKELVQGWDFGEGDGPGDYGSYVHLSVKACEVQ